MSAQVSPEIHLTLPKPTGEFSIQVGDKIYEGTNLVTQYGLDKLLTATTEIFNTSTGGLFSYCKVGSGVAPITEDSLNLGVPYAVNSVRSSTSLLFLTKNGQRYAQQTSTYTFTSGAIVGDITEISLCSNSDGTNMLCGTLLPASIPVDAGQQVVIIYSVRVPVLSQLTTRYTSPPVTLNGVTTGYFVELQTHAETSTNLICSLPVATPRVTNAPLSGFVINGESAANANGSYTCTRAVTSRQVTFNVTALIIGTAPSTAVSTFKYCRLDLNNYSLRVSFDSIVTKPAAMMFKVTTKIVIDWED